MTVTVTVIEDEDGADRVRDQLAGLLAASFAEPPYFDTPDDVEQTLRRFDRHCRKPGFRLVLASDGSTPVALGYGYRLPADTQWLRHSLTPVPDELQAEDGMRTFALFELCVHPDWRRRGIGRTVYARLIDGRPERRVILNCHPDAPAAQAAYRAWGYQRVTSVIPWQGAPAYDVMLLDLRRCGK